MPRVDIKKKCICYTNAKFCLTQWRVAFAAGTKTFIFLWRAFCCSVDREAQCGNWMLPHLNFKLRSIIHLWLMFTNYSLFSCQGLKIRNVKILLLTHMYAYILVLESDWLRAFSNCAIFHQNHFTICITLPAATVMAVEQNVLLIVFF